VLQEMQRKDREKKEELNKVNKNNMDLSYQIEEAEAEI